MCVQCIYLFVGVYYKKFYLTPIYIFSTNLQVVKTRPRRMASVFVTAPTLPRSVRRKVVPTTPSNGESAVVMVPRLNYVATRDAQVSRRLEASVESMIIIRQHATRRVVLKMHSRMDSASLTGSMLTLVPL